MTFGYDEDCQLLPTSSYALISLVLHASEIWRKTRYLLKVSNFQPPTFTTRFEIRHHQTEFIYIYSTSECLVMVILRLSSRKKRRRSLCQTEGTFTLSGFLSPATFRLLLPLTILLFMSCNPFLPPLTWFSSPPKLQFKLRSHWITHTSHRTWSTALSLSSSSSHSSPLSVWSIDDSHHSVCLPLLLVLTSIS